MRSYIKSLYLPTSLKCELKELVYSQHRESESLYECYCYVISYIIYYAKNYRDAYHKTGVPIHSETIYNIITKNDKSTIFRSFMTTSGLALIASAKMPGTSPFSG